MAYMNQELKKQFVKSLSMVVPKDWKYTLRVRNSSTLVFILRQAPVDILQDLKNHNFLLGENAMHVMLSRSSAIHYLSPGNAKVFDLIFDALNQGNHDNSDAMTDYFDVGWYVNVTVGEWDNPFLHVVKPPKQLKFKLGLFNNTAKSVNPIKPTGITHGTGSSEFSSKFKKKLDVQSVNKLKNYLPSGWLNMTPGKKAAATKKAMQLAGVA